MSAQRYRWAAPGDVNAFFGLMLDNIAGLLLMVGLLSAVFGFPTSFALGHMIPGTAFGVLVGDLLFFWMALKVARRTGCNTVTAMPLGLDTPSTFGMVLFVLGPAFLEAKRPTSDGGLGLAEWDAATYAWHIGICSIFVSGLFKLCCALASNWIRRMVPRAGLLGSLAAIALVLISFLPLLEVLHFAVVGLIALAIVLTTLVAHVRLPGRLPGTLGALLVAGIVYYVMVAAGLIQHDWQQFDQARDALMPVDWTGAFSFQWVAALDDTVKYLPIVIPFALATVVGGIDCTESAAAAGDEFDTNWVIGVEAVATVLASLCGGVIQTTPYIGHPAYKAMGGRAGYTLATALFVGGAGLLGYFSYLYAIIPKPTVFPILVFIGIEITAQSFHATPRRHYPAVAFACIPALAVLAMMFAKQVLDASQLHLVDLQNPTLRQQLQTILTLSNGFIVTSLLWASALAAIIDRRLWTAATYLAVAAGFSLIGIIHSPLYDGRMFLPWQLGPVLQQQRLPLELQWAPYRYAAGYLAAAVLLLAWGWWHQALPDGQEPRRETQP